jgi:hypothetical protein
MDVDAALSEVPVNIMPLLDDTDFKTIEDGPIAYNAAGMDLRWNFVTTAGAYTSTAVTPTTGGNYDWAHKGDGMYCIEIPASGGASINNDTEGFGWFTGRITGVLPWRGPVIGFRAATINNALIDSSTGLDLIADAILARDIGSGSGAGSLNERTVRSALRTIRNKTSVSAGTLTVCKEDDSTSAYTAAVTTNAAADPIVSIDPA